MEELSQAFKALGVLSPSGNTLSEPFPVNMMFEQKILGLWDRMFVQHSSLLAIKSPSLTPAAVFDASGHRKRFVDYVVRDTVTKEIFRADHYLRDWLSSHAGKGDTEGMGLEELSQAFKALGVLSPSGNTLSEPFPVNMMFSTALGPIEGAAAFLRPETAQAQFLNFKRLLECNNGKMPFGSASVGSAFRNEISPRSGLLRVREFTMAEIEYFADPLDSTHAEIDTVHAVVLPLLAAERQGTAGQCEKVAVKDAVEKGLFQNGIQPYFLARAFLFLERLGIDMERVRVRQHLPTERAHYSTDCWDIEISTSHGWTECVGVSDRGTYDLDCHNRAANTRLTVTVPIKPVKEKKLFLDIDKKLFGKHFRGESQELAQHLNTLDTEELGCVKKELEEKGEATVLTGGKEHTVPGEMLGVTLKEVTVCSRTYTPRVIEPSFGIGRILYCLLEHSFWSREEDENRVVFSFLPHIAPVQAAVVQLGASESAQREIVVKIKNILAERGIVCETDFSTASIGRKYSRFDEMGIPVVFTVDYDSPKNNSVTVRYRDTKEQKTIQDWQRVGLEVGDLLLSGHALR
ncbi:MAG: glycyl-tRNA synthetase [Amphiamblys sp. WSBS2006]|nr:MAG: glycyl-tRNA synthetase [Amphiamblys sp. WSBS2006]